MGTPRLELTIDNPEELASLLEDVLSWRQLRKLAKRNKLTQYSYLGKKGLSVYLAYQAENKSKRYNKPVDF
jgi:hypothetical protein